MAQVIAFTVKINGVDTAIRNEADLREAVKLTQREYNQADYGSDKRKELQKQLGQLKQLQKESRAEIRDTAREFEISADKGKGSYRALNAELVNLRRRYKELSREERDAFGPELLKRIGTLDKELKDLDAEMGNFQRNVGNYSEGFRDAFLNLGGFDLTALSNPATAVAAIGAAAIEATRYLLEMSEQVRELRGSVQNLTGATGDELNEFTARVSAIAQTFGESDTEILNAANTVANQLGIPFEQALANIEEGFVAGSNQTGEFLDSLREYPTFFAEAELGADALFRVINRQATEGIYSDKGVDAIKEATLRLRELPQTTRDALEAIGLDSEQIRREITENGIGGAIATVSERLGELESNSPEVGQAIADIFGGAGEDAGLAYLLTLKDLNAETGSLIDTTNEYQQQQARTLAVNQDFARVQTELADALGGTGSTLENVSTRFQTFLIQLIIPLINRFRRFYAATEPVRTSLYNLAEAVGLVSDEGSIMDTVFSAINLTTDLSAKAINLFSQGLAFVVDKITAVVGKGREFLEFIGVLEPATEQAAAVARNMGRYNREAAEELSRLNEQERIANEERKKSKEETDKLSESLRDLRDATNETAVATDAYAAGSLADLKSEISDLRSELEAADPDEIGGILSKLIDAEGALEKVEEFQDNLRERITRPVGPVAMLDTPEVEPFESFGERRLEIEREVSAETLEINENKNLSLLEQERQRAAAVAEIQQTIFSGISDSLSALTDVSESREEREIESLERRYQREIDLAEGNTEQQERLEAELDRERQAIQQREFERQKRYRVAAATASLAQGIVNILSAPTVIPDPFGTAFKAIRIGVLTATTAAQISAISQQSAARGRRIPEAGKGRVVVPMASSGRIVGGFARGASHSDPSGGILALLNGSPVMIEADEFVDTDETGAVNVINRRSAAESRNVLSAIYGRTFAGKGNLMSAINTRKNYGIPLAAAGATVRPDVSVLSGMSGGSQSGQKIDLSESTVSTLASRTAEAVQAGARSGIREGMSVATTEARNREIQSRRTKI